MNAIPSLRSPLSALTALLSFGLGSSALAQSVSTTPVGAMTYTFPATTQTTTTYISIPLTNPAVYTGPVASLTANTITFSGTPFTAGELAQAGSPFFVRIAAGPQAGRTMLVTANTTNSITVDTTDNSSQTTALDSSGWALAAGNKVEVIVGDTLASLLGDNSGGNPLLYVGTTSAFTADTIGIYNKSTSKFDVYYFNTTSGFWRLSSGTISANNTVIYPETALQINRRSGRSSTTLTIVGDVPTAAPLNKTVGGSQIIYTSPRYPIDVTLAQLNLTNWTKANSAFTADTISIYNPTTSKMDTYYQRLDNSQWRKSTDSVTDASNLIIPAGSSISILKRAATSGTTSMLAASMPYTL